MAETTSQAATSQSMAPDALVGVKGAASRQRRPIQFIPDLGNFIYDSVPPSTAWFGVWFRIRPRSDTPWRARYAGEDLPQHFSSRLAAENALRALRSDPPKRQELSSNDLHLMCGNGHRLVANRDGQKPVHYYSSAGCRQCGNTQRVWGLEPVGWWKRFKYSVALHLERWRKRTETKPNGGER